MACCADRSKRLVYRPLATEESRRTIVAVWHRQRYHSPAAEFFLKELRTSCNSDEVATSRLT